VAHRFANILVHIVFSTKNRENLIIDTQLREKLWRYFTGIGKNYEIPMLAAGGTANHAHLLLALPADIAVAKAVQVFKANSSRWLREHSLNFSWQEGYGAFSVSASDVAAVKDYIQHQAEHHAKRSYEDEFLAFLRKNEINYELGSPGTDVPGFPIPLLRSCDADCADPLALNRPGATVNAGAPAIHHFSSPSQAKS
jgi:putative transposase